MASYLETLRRIPDDVFLAIWASDFDEQAANSCICGWALRHNLLKVTGRDPVTDGDGMDDPLYTDLPSVTLAARFGGESGEWREVFTGAASEYFGPEVELAVVDRLNEILSDTPTRTQE